MNLISRVVKEMNEIECDMDGHRRLTDFMETHKEHLTQM